MELLIDLYRRSRRLGPGGDEATAMALELAGLDQAARLHIADIGCGTGASTLVLGRLLNARITAVDFAREFLDELEQRAESAGLTEKITTLCCAMQELPFAKESFDVIWSEGAIYNIGFERGVREWHRYLQAGGVLVVSEITWLTDSRPQELQQRWEAEYPEIDLASAKLRILEQNGYSPIGYFVLPESCWLENYYLPLQDSFQSFLARHGDSDEARAVVEATRQEIALYNTSKAYYGYGVYIARKSPSI